MKKAYDIIVLTDMRYLEDSKTDLYKHNVFFEDSLVIEGLNKKGLKTGRLAWDDSHFDWSCTKSVLFRTTWDYFERFPEFSIWLENVSKQTRLFNSETLIRWNIDKHYLIDLKNNGIPITQSHFIEIGTRESLKSMHTRLGWSETVLKPCVSGAARHTYKLTLDSLDTHEAIYQKLIAKEAMMLQPFQYNIVAKGEISMMVFNGQFTHAILKKVKVGDFRVQDDFGGSVHDYQAATQEIEFAETTVKACPELPIYARVDIFYDNSDQLALSELELIEPELWFRNYPNATNILADAICNLL